MTAVNGAATNNGDFIYAFKGSGTTTGAYTMKPSQHLIGAGATLNVPTIGPLVTIAGVDANTPTIGGTITLAGNVTVAGIDTSTDASNGFAGTSVSGVTVNVRNVATTTGTGVTIGGSEKQRHLAVPENLVERSGERHLADEHVGELHRDRRRGSSRPRRRHPRQNDGQAGRRLAHVRLGRHHPELDERGDPSLKRRGNVTLRNMTILSNGSGINTGGDGITVSNSSNLSLDNVLIQNQAGNFVPMARRFRPSRCSTPKSRTTPRPREWRPWTSGTSGSTRSPGRLPSRTRSSTIPPRTSSPSSIPARPRATSSP